MPKETFTGTIEQLDKDKPRNKCRKWRVSYPLKRDPATGKYRRKYRAVNGTYTDARQELEKLREEIEGGEAQAAVVQKPQTLDDYRQEYYERRKASGRVAPNTYNGDDNRLKAVCHVIGKTKMQRITPAMLEKTYVEMRNGNSPSGRPLSCTYVHDCAITLSTLMEDAKVHGIIADNPCKLAAPPKRDTKEKKALSQDKVKEFIEKLDVSDPMAVAVYLCATLGLRRGEAVGLSWEDVDFDVGCIHIAHSFSAQGEMRPTKTKAGNRMLPMPAAVAEVLKAFKEAQAQSFAKSVARQHKIGNAEFALKQTPKTAIACDSYGNRFNPCGLGRWWNKHREGFSLDGWTLHELRHSFVTNAILLGISPAVVQDLAGHATPEVTMAIYTHVNMEAKNKAMDAIAACF